MSNEEKICPICNRPYSYIWTRKIGGREVKYAVHETIKYEDGKRERIVERCRLTPKVVKEGGKVQLLEVFKDIQLKYEAKSTKEEGKEAYVRQFEIIPKPSFEPITLDKLKAYAEKLNQQIPTFKFYVEEVNVKGKRLIVIRRSDKPISIEKLEGEISNLKIEFEVNKRLLPKFEEDLKEAQREYEKVKAQFENKARELEDLTKTNIIKRLINFWRIREAKMELAYISQLLNFLNEKVKKAEEKVEAQKVMIREYEEKLKTSTEELEKVKEKAKEMAEGKMSQWLPIYFDLENQKVYVEKPLWEREPKLYTYALHRCLGWLGMVTVRHIAYVH
jgi:DNA repair exonuclease SbcCD ATPase subunit